ncbi:hypothetical protein Vadar_026537 [Vaccinium darrowii]|uniref:Uncharacterized protein n=1 Tax=Vaccinium darrowii TaxID=229202 RepID=A0ACB7XTE2_9ERIC|nr:hypothetical protein Vadar_026537 [Vaccinium darrowii]
MLAFPLLFPLPTIGPLRRSCRHQPLSKDLINVGVLVVVSSHHRPLSLHHDGCKKPSSVVKIFFAIFLNAGVKGLIDAGMVEVPKIFIRPPDELSEYLRSPQIETQVPVINLGNIRETLSRERVVNKVRIVSEEWGFFQVVNHGIPSNVLEEMIDGIRMFREEDPDEKRAAFTRSDEKSEI